MYYNFQRNSLQDLPENQISKYYSPQRYKNLYTSNIFQQPPKYPLPEIDYKKYQQSAKLSGPNDYGYPETNRQLYPYINKHLIKNDLGWDGVKLVQYVTNNLDKQQYMKDSAIIQKFRLQAQQRKKKKRHHQMHTQSKYRVKTDYGLQIPTQKQTPIQKQEISQRSVNNPQSQEQQYVMMIPCRDEAINTSQLQIKLPQPQLQPQRLKKQKLKTQKLKQKYRNLKNRYKELRKFQNKLEEQHSLQKIAKSIKQVQLAIATNKSLAIVPQQIKLSVSDRSSIKSRIKTQPQQDYTKHRHQSQQQEQYEQISSKISKNQSLSQSQIFESPKSKPMVVYTPVVGKPKFQLQNQRKKISNFLQSLKSKRKRIEYSTINN